MTQAVSVKQFATTTHSPRRRSIVGLVWLLPLSSIADHDINHRAEEAYAADFPTLASAEAKPSDQAPGFRTFLESNPALWLSVALSVKTPLIRGGCRSLVCKK